jgi:hypothetical protein
MQDPMIRRCKDCGVKAHKMYWVSDNWIGERCPVCGGTNYVESRHGGLTPTEIDEARRKFQKSVHKIEGDSPPSVERQH